MWRKIKEFIFTETDYKTKIEQDLLNDLYGDAEQELITNEALQHYCPICKRGFERKNGKKNHNRFKHKE